MNKKYLILALALIALAGVGYKYSNLGGLKGSFADYAAKTTVADAAHVFPAGNAAFSVFKDGDTVLARGINDPNQWYPGIIKKNNTDPDGTFTMNYFDGSSTPQKSIKDLARFDIHPSLASLNGDGLIIVKSKNDLDEQKIPRYYLASVTSNINKTIVITKFGTLNPPPGPTITLSDIFYPGALIPKADKPTLTDAETRTLIAQHLQWKQVKTSQDSNTGNTDVQYSVSLDTKGLTGSKSYTGLKLSVLRNPYWGNADVGGFPFPVGQLGNAEQKGIITYAPFSISLDANGLHFCKKTSGTCSPDEIQGMLNTVIDGVNQVGGKLNALNVEDQADGSLLVTVHLPFPDFPAYGADFSKVGKTDIDFAFTDNAGVKIATKMIGGTNSYDTVQIPMPRLYVGVQDGDIYFYNKGGMLPRNYLHKLVFYATGGRSATTLDVDVLSAFDIDHWATDGWPKSEWSGTDYGSKVWLLYDRNGAGYNDDATGHAGLPTIYSADVNKTSQGILYPNHYNTDAP